MSMALAPDGGADIQAPEFRRGSGTGCSGSRAPGSGPVKLVPPKVRTVRLSLPGRRGGFACSCPPAGALRLPGKKPTAGLCRRRHGQGAGTCGCLRAAGRGRPTAGGSARAAGGPQPGSVTRPAALAGRRFTAPGAWPGARRGPLRTGSTARPAGRTPGVSGHPDEIGPWSGKLGYDLGHRRGAAAPGFPDLLCQQPGTGRVAQGMYGEGRGRPGGTTPDSPGGAGAPGDEARLRS